MATDASIMAYLRALGFTEAEARAYAARERDRVNRQVSLQVPEVQESAMEERRNIGLNMEGRGMLRSGETTRREARSRASELSTIGQIEGGAADQLAGIESDLAREVAQTRRQRAEYGY